MLERNHLNISHFNSQFLKFRIRHYFNETRELLARHKLLIAFIICLLIPEVNNIQAIGIPFYSIIAPENTLKMKLIYLVSLLFFLLAMTNAQSSFIKGGVFREYLHTFYIPTRVSKKIDLIVLLLSLNSVWLAVLFGGVSILHSSKEPLFISSQYFLYGSMVMALITLLLNSLYRKIANSLLLCSALVLVAYISMQGSWVLNYGIGCLVCLLCGIIIWTVQPSTAKQAHLFKITQVGLFNRFSLWTRFFVIQLAVYRENKASFLTRLALCFVISALILKIGSFPNAPKGLFFVLVAVQTYILSTLFTFFEKGKLDHVLFHQIFPYQQMTQQVRELIVIMAGLVVTLLPIALFDHPYFLLLLVALVMSSITIIINRFLYMLSLRFCLFTSLINTVGGCVAQYIFSGVFFGY